VIVEQSVHLGVRAVFIVGLLTFLTGLILAFQSAYQLERFGAAIYMAEIVSLGVVREFAPLMTAIILAGRNSSAIAAELGTMAVRDEIDALRTTGIDPISFLVLPRLWAITLVQPALTVLAMCFGLAGGLLVAWMLGLPTLAVFHRMRETLTPHDFMLGLFKSFLFAWIVGCTGCYMGLTTNGGASSVGRNTTRAVVVAIFLIVVVDSLVTTAWTLLGYGER
jgi:phospholipid/cholesterol/gamma-HCH transport system permease protein